MKLRRAAKILIRRRSDGLYLILWSSKWEERPDRSQKPDIPGGVVEENESMIEGLLREVREEIGVAIHPGSLHLAHALTYDHNDWSSIFEIYFAEINGDESITLSWEHESFRWLTADEVLAMEIRQPYPGIFAHMRDIGYLV